MRGPSCLFAAKEVFVTGAMLAAEAVCIGVGRLAVAGVTCGFQVLPPLRIITYGLLKDRNPACHELFAANAVCHC